MYFAWSARSHCIAIDARRALHRMMWLMMHDGDVYGSRTWPRSAFANPWGSPRIGGTRALPPYVKACLLALVQRIRNSLHIGAADRANFGFKSCTSKLMFLVCFSNLKLLPRA